MWKRLVEKPVEIVEKCEFSTAILKISNSAPWKSPCIHRCIRQESGGIHKIMSPWEPVRYLAKLAEKVSKLPKQPGLNKGRVRYAAKFL